jgi:hypothetical protein
MGVPWGIDPVEGSLSAIDKDLVLLTGYTSFHVLSNPVVHPRPGEVLFSLPNCFVSPWVTCSRMVMDQGHEVLLLGFRYSINADGLHKFLRWEDDHVSVVLLPLVSGRGSREDIRPGIGFPRYVVDNEVVLLQVCMPPGHSSIEVLWGFPVLEVCVIGEDNEGKFGPP